MIKNFILELHYKENDSNLFKSNFLFILYTVFILSHINKHNHHLESCVIQLFCQILKEFVYSNLTILANHFFFYSKTKYFVIITM
jgi:hypothetical protein